MTHPLQITLHWRSLLRAARNVFLILVPLAMLLAFYCTMIEPGWLQLTHTNAPIRDIPQALEGFTLVQISDLHFGIGVGEKLTDQVITQMAALEPDLVVLTGDFVDAGVCHEHPDDAERVAEQLARLHGRYGVYAVLGNHDVVCGADNLSDLLRRKGVPVLRNERVVLEANGARLWLIDIENAPTEMCPGWASFEDTHRAERDALEQLLADVPEDDTRIVLVHNPDFEEMLAGERVDLVLAGHTHGAYLRLPYLSRMLSPSCFGDRFLAGLNEGSYTQVYTNRGVGGLSIRLNDRPEVAVLRLTRAAQ
jgi:predicted MPP superfamily phosphohydrolase